jgi:hypothetical protein
VPSGTIPTHERYPMSFSAINILPLISVLVTEIQAIPSLGDERKSFRRADARRLDSCDRHRNEGRLAQYLSKTSIDN